MQRFETESQRLVFQLLTIFVFILLVGRLFTLQVLERGRFAKLSSGNAARLIPMNGPRGIIYDRNGKVMVSNRMIFSVVILPPSVDNLNDTVDYLNRITGVAKAKIVKLIEDKKDKPFEPVTIIDNIPMSMVAKLEEQKYKYPGVVVSNRPVRYYVNGASAVHVVGYIGEITQDELNEVFEGNYRSGSIIGKDGVEKSYDSYLRGIDGGMEIEVNAAGQPVRVLRNIEPVQGKDVYLTIDMDLQKVVERALRGKPGAVVVMNPRTGEILAMASYPDFDPNMFSAPLEDWRWKLATRYGYPFMNRALAAYPPGSTFKVITQSAVLQEKLSKTTDTYYCPGSYKIGNRVAFCWNKSGHGTLDLTGGLVWSCNVLHYQLALKAGPEILADYARKFGLGTKTGIDLPEEAKGTVPDSKWKEENTGEPWYPGDTINYGIGQGYLTATPLQMASVYSLIANGSNAYVPYIVKEVRDRRGEVYYAGSPKVRMGLPVGWNVVEHLREALRQVVYRGTGIAAKVPGIPAAGKTGTAEVPPKLPHA
ncbi:MAG: penicillin-binding protein 2, partial [bacterium]